MSWVDPKQGYNGPTKFLIKLRAQTKTLFHGGISIYTTILSLINYQLFDRQTWLLYQPYEFSY